MPGAAALAWDQRPRKLLDFSLLRPLKMPLQEDMTEGVLLILF